MIDTVTGHVALPLGAQLKALLDQEARYQPKLSGLRVIEVAQDNGLRMTVALRECEVRDLFSLTMFFGFSSETFSLAVNILDRFLATMKIQPKHLACVGLCCFYVAVKASEEERKVPLASELLRISQNRFTVSDMVRMEKIVLEKLGWRLKAPTALHFLRLLHSLLLEQVDDLSKTILSLEKLESQLKACHCSFVFSKVKPSLLAMALLALEIQEQHEHEHIHLLQEALRGLQPQLNMSDGDLVCVRELVAKCLVEYSSTKCSRPTRQRLRWVISGRTARQLKHSYYKIAHLPTIQESAF